MVFHKAAMSRHSAVQKKYRAEYTWGIGLRRQRTGDRTEGRTEDGTEDGTENGTEDRTEDRAEDRT